MLVFLLLILLVFTDGLYKMGKGKYNSDSHAESIMYWTTDLGFDVDISEFVKSETEERNEHGWMCHV